MFRAKQTFEKNSSISSSISKLFTTPEMGQINGSLFPPYNILNLKLANIMYLGTKRHSDITLNMCPIIETQV